MQDELKPCHQCKNTDLYNDHNGIIICAKCGWRVLERNEEIAIKYWNANKNTYFPMNEQITITKEKYLELRLCEEKLGFLEGGGVDNWEWYGDSLNPEGEESYCETKERLKKGIMGL